jgi:hypothetical protein
MARRYDRRYDPARHTAPFVTVPNREPRTVSIRELKWNARLGVVSQLVYLLGKLPHLALVVVLVAVFAGGLLVVALAAALWPFLLAAAGVYLAGRSIARAHRRAAQRRADRDDLPF